jgi:hypothetical protein
VGLVLRLLIQNPEAKQEKKISETDSKPQEQKKLDVLGANEVVEWLIPLSSPHTLKDQSEDCLTWPHSKHLLLQVEEKADGGACPEGRKASVIL